MTDFSQQHVLISGGGTGIGFAIAQAFSKKGSKVTLAGRNEDRLKEKVKDLKKAQAVAMDVTDESSIAKGLEKANQAFGPVDILINNAGAVESAPLNGMDSGLWQRMLDVNLTGVFLLTHAVFPKMKKFGWGRIINVASTAGLEGYAYTSAYCAAKHGVVGFTRALAEEFKKDFTINAVCPGFTRTDMVERAIINIMEKTGLDRDRAEAEIIKLNPGGRLIEPEEVADVVLKLAAGDDNGQIIPLTGEPGDLGEKAGENGRDALRLWLQLITLTKVVEKKIRNNFRTEFETTLPRFDIMATLDRSGEKLTMGGLTERLLVSKGNVTGVVASLVRQGFIKRERDPGDKRTHYLSLTTTGRREFAIQAKAHQGWVDDYFSGLNMDELSTMVDQLVRLKATITENHEGKAE